jgi:hypothetical protein
VNFSGIKQPVNTVAVSKAAPIKYFFK